MKVIIENRLEIRCGSCGADLEVDKDIEYEPETKCRKICVYPCEQCRPMDEPVRLWNGQKLKARLKELKMTQAKLGENLGISRQAISNWIKNKTEPKGGMLVHLAVCLHIREIHLFDREMR